MCVHVRYTRKEKKALLPDLEPFVGPLRPSPLWCLAPICPPSLNLLILAQARPQADVDPRRRGEAKALGHLHQVELVHVKHRPQAVRGICLEIRPVSVLGRFVEIVVFRDKGFELRLDVYRYHQ